MSVRGRLLQRAFNLLYGPLVFLHEPAGVCLFGAAWHGRRTATLDLIDGSAGILDVGCGQGNLLRAAQDRGLVATGIDPAVKMLGNSSRKQLNVVRAPAACMPFVDESFSGVVCTYPGAWIRDPHVWSEIERVMSLRASVVVLLGGNVNRGRVSTIRAFLARLSYGSGNMDAIEFDPPLGADTRISGQLQLVDDEWGTLVRWVGRRAVA